MKYKDMFEEALTEVSDRYTFSSDHDMAETIAERAKNMKKDINVVDNSHPGLIEITPEYAEPKKSTKILHAVAGLAGAAAVLTGGFFGLKWLNENGGLKEGGSDELRAGYSQNAAAATTAGEEQPEFTTIFQSYSITDDSGYVKVDQRYGIGDDITVHLKGYKFDGLWANIYYDLIFKDEIMGGEFRQRVSPNDTEYGHVESVEYEIEKNIASATAHYRLNDNEPAESVEVTFGYEDDQPSELFGLTMFKSTDDSQTPAVTTVVYMTTPDNGDAPVMTEETTVTTDVLVTSEYATEDAAEMHDDTTYPIPQVQIIDGTIDHTDVTLALGEGNVKILPGRIYDGRILKLRLTGDIDDETHIGIRSVKNPRNINQGGHKNDDGTYTFSALIDVPDGETDTLELLDIGTLKTEGKPKAIEVINVSGIADYEPLTERVGLDMTQWGMPYETLEWLTLSPFGLELSFTSDTNWKSPNISVEWTTLNGTVCKSRGHSGTGNYDESTGKYYTNLLIVPDEDTDLTEMKEFSINGLKTKRAEFMPKSFWDIPESENELTPVETFVQTLSPEE